MTLKLIIKPIFFFRNVEDFLISRASNGMEVQPVHTCTGSFKSYLQCAVNVHNIVLMHVWVPASHCQKPPGLITVQCPGWTDTREPVPRSNLPAAYRLTDELNSVIKSFRFLSVYVKTILFQDEQNRFSATFRPDWSQ